MTHVRGLDAIRLFAAMVVAVSHYNLDLRSDLAFLGPVLADYANKIFGLLWNGQAAVIVFFVVSGFVIHFPYASGRKFNLGDFYARRFVRMVPPALVAGAAFVWFGLLDGRGWNDTIFWSLICEVIYYALYPLIFWGLARGLLRMPILLAASVVAAALLFAVNLDIMRVDTNYFSLGYATWIFGLPCWLAGCWLAENTRRFKAASGTAIAVARLAMLALGGAAMLARNAPGLFGVFSSNIVLLNVCTPAIVIWLGIEIAHNNAQGGGHRLQHLFDRCGAASYSLYLVHMLVFSLVAFPVRDLARLPIYLALVAGVTAAFYFAIERPSHGLARTLGRRVALQHGAAARY